MPAAWILLEWCPDRCLTLVSSNLTLKQTLQHYNIYKCFGHLSKGALYKIAFWYFIKMSSFKWSTRMCSHLQVINHSRYACCMDLTRVVS
jgi:hypothetical protein